MVPQKELSLRDKLKFEIVLHDTSRRLDALNVLKEKGFDEFAIKVAKENISLHYPGFRSHKMRSKYYVMRKEDLNDNFFAKAVLDKEVSSEDLIKLFDLSFEFERFEIIYQPTFEHVESFIEIRDKTWVDNYKGPCGVRGIIGPGDDGYGGKHCGFNQPELRQFLNDPYSILMTLFIRGDRKLIDHVLEKDTRYKPFLPGTMELFLNSEGAFEEIKLMNEYTTNVLAHDFITRVYRRIVTELMNECTTNLLIRAVISSVHKNKEIYDFLRRDDSTTLPYDKVYYIDAHLVDIFGRDPGYVY